MPFKKLSRRTFLTASSALAFLHTPFARALPARPSVNINDYNPHDWIASFKQAFSEGQTAFSQLSGAKWSRKPTAISANTRQYPSISCGKSCGRKAVKI